MAALNDWKKALKYAVDYPQDGGVDPEHPNCPICGGRMYFYAYNESGSLRYGKGYWACPVCGFRVTEEEL